MTYPEPRRPFALPTRLQRRGDRPTEAERIHELMNVTPPDVRINELHLVAAPVGTEERIVNATTGGEKGSKLERYDLIPVEPLAEVARLYGAGAAKYADNNWRRGYDWHLSYAALQRHVNAFWGGESMDSETRRHHLASAVFHCLALMDFEREHPELDDRYKPGA